MTVILNRWGGITVTTTKIHTETEMVAKLRREGQIPADAEPRASKVHWDGKGYQWIIQWSTKTHVLVEPPERIA